MESEIQFTNEYSAEKVGEVKNLLAQIHDKLSDEQRDELSIRISKKAQELRSKYKDAVQYGLYHALAWSTIAPSMNVIYNDFPGEDSIENLLHKLNQEYSS